MIYSVTAENEAGEQLEMRLSCPQFSGMNIYNITGIGTPKADILTIESPNIDGSVFNAMKQPERNANYITADVDAVEEVPPYKIARARERNIVMYIKYVDSDFTSGFPCVKPDDVIGVCTDSYNDLLDKPQINSIELVGNKRGEELGLQNEMEPIPMPRIEKWLMKYWEGEEIT